MYVLWDIEREVMLTYRYLMNVPMRLQTSSLEYCRKRLNDAEMLAKLPSRALLECTNSLSL